MKAKIFARAITIALAIAATSAIAAIVTMDNGSTQKSPTSVYNAKAITPNDTDTFSAPVMVFVGGAGGTLSVLPAQGATPVGMTVVAGQLVPLYVVQVRATGTTATGLLAFY